MIPKYVTKIEQRKLQDKVFVLEVINDLDDAIELLCESLGPHPNPFAEDLCPYYGVLWPSAEALAGYISNNLNKMKGKRVIEVGCGLGFPSLTAAHFGINVLATDFHPDVVNFLARNQKHNSVEVAFERLNWRNDQHTLGKFDIVMGSDVLYEPKHPGDVAAGFERLLAPGGEVWVVDPGRGYLQKFLDEMEKAGFKHSFEPQTINKQELFLFRFFRD
ncbi:MAG: methyltransferase domain-containing protein [Bacteriovoracaceae bacterium]|nr:methyltransferase domain-containing protein [Bacteriovoracaceae bacterium]